VIDAREDAAEIIEGRSVEITHHRVPSVGAASNLRRTPAAG
jgi:hypothetical protein